MLDTNKKWNDFLDQNYCKKGAVSGQRPCDDGVTCSDCRADGVADLFQEWSKTHKTECLVVYFFEVQDDSGEIRQHVCDSRNELSEFVSNYGKNIEIVDIETEYR